MIKLVDIKKTYDRDGVKTHALKGINLEVNKGEMIAIMGSSGSGKTTLLNILGGIDSASGGDYFFEEITVNALAAKELAHFRRDHISFIFQNYYLLSDYTVSENVEVPLRLKSIQRKDREEKVRQTLEKLGILDIRKKYPKHISGGQKQRVGIARAFVSDADLILADEPTGALDRENSEIIMDLICQTRDKGTTVIIVTHDMTVADYCDRVVTLGVDME